MFRKILHWLRELEWRWSLAAMIGGNGIISAIMAWLSDSVNWINQFGAFGWAMTFILVFFIVAISLASLTWISIHWSGTKRFSGSDAAVKEPTHTIQGRHYKNETVLIDDYHFIECVFENCTIKYDGGPWRFTQIKANLPLSIQSGNTTITSALELFTVLSSSREVIVDSSGRRRVNVPAAINADHQDLKNEPEQQLNTEQKTQP